MNIPILQDDFNRFQIFIFHNRNLKQMSGRRPSAKSAREALVSFRSLPSLDPTLNEEDLAVAA